MDTGSYRCPEAGCGFHDEPETVVDGDFARRVEEHIQSHRGPDDVLTAFLYTLIRDHLPFGVVIRIVEDLNGIASREFRLTNPHAAYLARDLAARIRGGR